VKRWVTASLLFLLLLSGGAVVNVAVAWACVLWSDSAAYETIQAPYWRPPDIVCPWLVPADAEYEWLRGHGWTPKEPDEVFGVFYVTPIERRAFGMTQRAYFEQPDYGVFSGVRRATGPYNGAHDAFAYRTRAGWPFRSVEAGTFGVCPDSDTPLNHVWGIGVTVTADYGVGIPASESRPLPYRPIWPGFLVNTFIFAVLLWLVFSLRFALRRLNRFNHGCCPNCGYDLRGQFEAGCPQCQWGRAQSPRIGASARRRLRSGLLFLLLGAILNIAVAWGFALSGNSPRAAAAAWQAGSFRTVVSDPEALEDEIASRMHLPWELCALESSSDVL
jgi:hypothetical protein